MLVLDLKVLCDTLGGLGVIVLVMVVVMCAFVCGCNSGVVVGDFMIIVMLVLVSVC